MICTAASIPPPPRCHAEQAAARHPGHAAILTYATIAAGEPASTAAITSHYLTQTLPKEVSDLARYYTQGAEIPERRGLRELGDAAAELRRDLHPLAAKGLGVDPERPLTQEEIGALLAGRRADGEKIAGKHYSTLREYTDPKTGVEEREHPARRGATSP